MAINDIKISQLADIAQESITDDSILPLVESDSNFKITMAQIKEFTQFLLTNEPEITSTELSANSEFVVNEAEQSKITLVELMTYIKDNIPKVPVRDRGSLRLETSGSTQTIVDDATPVLLTCFDAIVTERGNLVPDEAANSIKYVGVDTINSAIVSIGLNVIFPGTEELEVYLYINNVAYSDTPINMQGEGTGKPTVNFWQSDIQLFENDELTLRGRNADAGSFDITYLRSTFRVDIN